ncbi:hypothetical protein [Allopontixanthobacter sp.]|uniref:hypothetical protein n=1 Tax=Allopontixanthobacter sp. TaxID=2906452 RepID=UPI002AB88982|nr:hypothetical protein [Allopontixanthobacter sp.]MDZ4307659.1 hypothetical protein [Allopontixanthobacter sp.]
MAAGAVKFPWQISDQPASQLRVDRGGRFVRIERHFGKGAVLRQEDLAIELRKKVRAPQPVIDRLKVFEARSVDLVD